MNKVQHHSNNAVLGAPANWDQKVLPCNALPVTRAEVDGVPVVVSYWRPSPSDLAALNAGQHIALSVVGVTMPPVAMFVAP